MVKNDHCMYVGVVITVLRLKDNTFFFSHIEETHHSCTLINLTPSIETNVWGKKKADEKRNTNRQLEMQIGHKQRARL